MLETFAPLAAFGPIGGIDPSVAVFWIVLWTVVLGGILYASMVFYPQWVDMGDAEDTNAHGGH